MLRFDSKNKNFNATSMANDIVVANFNANLNEPDSTLYINISADNTARFSANLATIKIDFEAFVDEVLGITE